MHALITSHRDALAALCRRFGVARLEVFGSAARATDFDPAQSDVDLLVAFAPEARPSFATLLDLQGAAEQLLAHPVDLIERQAVEESENYLRRRRILAEAQLVFAA